VAVAAPIPALATPSPSAAPPAPTHHEGNGSDRQALAKPGPGVVVAQVSHDGAGPFTVHALDGVGSRRDLVVSSVGPYRGARLLDGDGRESARFEVRADGPWTVDLVPLAAAPSWSGREPLDGRGDAVVVVPGGLSRFTLTQVVHGGARSFAVWAYSATSRDLVVNRVGRHDGRHALAPGVLLLAVTADGPWSITPRSS
jgi:hypothetical protein